MYFEQYTSGMKALVWTLLLLDIFALFLLSALPLGRLRISDFSLRSRLKGAPKNKAHIVRFLHKNQAELTSVRTTGLVICGSGLVALIGWLVGSWLLAVVYSLAIFLAIALLRRVLIFQQLSEGLFIKYGDYIAPVLKTMMPFFRILTDKFSYVHLQPESIEEFTNLLQRIPSTVVSPLQRQRLENILAAEDLTVKDIMTPKKQVVLADPSATLGPVVLTDLQRSGHRYFPVSKKKSEIIGILDLSDVTDVGESKKHQKVKDAMQVQFATVRESDELYKLAEVFLYEKEYILIVLNEKDDFVGLVTIADFMRQVLSVVTED